MIKSIAATLVCITAVIAPVWAQTLDEGVITQYYVLKRSNSTAGVCAHEVLSMQVERNRHYDVLHHADTQSPDDPTSAEMSDLSVQLHLEDTTLKQKREECMPLLDEVIAAAQELRRRCEAVVTSSELVTTKNSRVTAICNGTGSAEDPSPH
jgi:hypothetical protein